MTRRLFNFVAVVSLLLCIGTAVLLVRSYRIGDVFIRLDTGPIAKTARLYEVTVESTKGMLFLYRFDRAIDDMVTDGAHRPRLQYTKLEHFDAGFLFDDTIRRWKFHPTAGFGWKHEIVSDKTWTDSEIEAVIPLWLIAILFAIPPHFAIPSWRRSIKGRARPAFPIITKQR